jgi:hypothetical protein
MIMGKTHQKVSIEAPVQHVWTAVRNFHDMQWSKNVITECKPVGDIPGDQVGSQRLLNGAFSETLLELDDAQRTFSYGIDDGPSPISQKDVSNYIGRVRVAPSGDGRGTVVEWSSSWDGNDEAYEFCHNIYVALLDDLKTSMEQPES